MVKQLRNFMTEPEKKKSVTFMMKPSLKKEIDHLAIELGCRPCDALERVAAIGLDKLAELGMRHEVSSARSPSFVETGAKYRVSEKGEIAKDEV